MDFDVDMDDVAADVGYEESVPDIPLGQDILNDEHEEPGEVIDEAPPTIGLADDDDDEGAQTPVPNKVHIRGLDTLHTDDIKAYVRTTFGDVEKVEWVDDTSANLVFLSDSAARDALKALSTIQIEDVTALAIGETLPAKPIEGRPEVSLSVRLAVGSDKKQAGAALRSRYYLLHPEHDPEERRRKQQENRQRYRDRERDHKGYGRRRRRSEGDEEEVEKFEASMYDDAPRAMRRPQRSRSRSRSRSAHRRENRGKELFGARTSSRKDRSASPRRDAEGDDDMDLLASSSSQNRTRARSIKDRINSNSNNSSKELFPSRGPARTTRGGGNLDALDRKTGSGQLEDSDRPKIVDVPGKAAAGSSFSIKGMASKKSEVQEGFSIKGSANARELFPGKFGPSNTAENAGKELFGGNRRRQKAQDLFG